MGLTSPLLFDIHKLNMANPELGMPVLPQPEVISGEVPGDQDSTDFLLAPIDRRTALRKIGKGVALTAGAGLLAGCDLNPVLKFIVDNLPDPNNESTEKKPFPDDVDEMRQLWLKGDLDLIDSPYPPIRYLRDSSGSTIRLSTSSTRETEKDDMKDVFGVLLGVKNINGKQVMLLGMKDKRFGLKDKKNYFVAPIMMGTNSNSLIALEQTGSVFDPTDIGKNGWIPAPEAAEKIKDVVGSVIAVSFFTESPQWASDVIPADEDNMDFFRFVWDCANKGFPKGDQVPDYINKDIDELDLAKIPRSIIFFMQKPLDNLAAVS